MSCLRDLYELRCNTRFFRPSKSDGQSFDRQTDCLKPWLGWNFRGPRLAGGKIVVWWWLMVVNGDRCLMMFDIMVWNQRVSLKPPVKFFASLRLRKLRNSWDGSKKNPAANSEERSVLLGQTEFHRISSLEVSCWLLFFPSYLFNVGSVFSPTKNKLNKQWSDGYPKYPPVIKHAMGNFPFL